MRFSSIRLVFAVGVLCACGREVGLSPDLVVLNANVITVDETRPRAEALAVLDGKFVAVGIEAEIEALVGEGTRVIDAAGRTVTPGFIDAHMHPSPTYPPDSRLARVDLRPSSVSTMEALIESLRAKASKTPEGEWVQGRGYEDTKLGRHPTRRDLDLASTAHPIYITHSSGHLGVVNSFVLKSSGISAKTPDPPGGAIDRDPDGEPNGVCREGACGMVRRGVSPESPPTRQEAVAGVTRTFQRFASEGITTVVDARASPRSFGVYQEIVRAGSPVRITVMFAHRYLERLKEMGIRMGLGSEWLRVGGIKTSHGNSLSGRTAWLNEPYEATNPETGKRDYYGIPPRRSQVELDALILEIHEADFQAAVHSNGDREIEMLLVAFDRALREIPWEDHRHRIEHASVANPAILSGVKELGLVLALHSYVYEHGDKMEAYGASRWGMMHANRSALDLGIPVAGNSDFPVSAADPLLRIQSMVTRTSAEGKVYGEEQRVTPEEAIHIWTMGSAYSIFEEGNRGSIEVGKVADFVLLSDDPTRVSPDLIKNIDVEMTVVGGKVVFVEGQEL